MDFWTFIYLFYSFVGFYYLILFVLIYFQNKNQVYESPDIKEEHSLSIVVPCFNEQESIGKTIETLLDSDYKGLKKVIVVDDKSTDDSFKIMKQYQKKYPDKVLAVQTPKNTGCAGGAKNYGAKFVETELIGFTDADSYPEKSAITRMIGYFDDPKTGAVTSRVLVYNRQKFLARLQSIEYKIIAFTRKLLGFVDAIYVTNGPLSIYRKKGFDELGGFDLRNMTEDIEITWHFVAAGYKVHMAIPSKVYTVVPDNFKAWLKQRTRWNIGGIQTILKYKKSFFRCGMLGYFILPFFITAWLLGITGLGILSYRLSEFFLARFLTAKQSIEAEVALITFNEFQLAPNILLFFGILLFVLSLAYNILALTYSRDENYKRHTVFEFTIYLCFYLLVYPIVLIRSVYKFLQGRYAW